MRVLFLTHSSKTPSVRYRVTQYLSLFEDAGINCTVHSLESGIDGWLGANRGRDYDLVVLQKKLPAVLTLTRIRRNARRLVYDFDDAVLYRRREEGVEESRTRIRRFRAIVRMADVVLAGNATLVELAEHHGARKVALVPTSVDPSVYREPADRNGRTLGWIGAGRNLDYIQAIQPALEALALRFPGLTLKLICNRFFSSSKLRIIPMAWSIEGEVKEVATFDVGLAPLPDDPWTRGKCGLRIMHYFAGRVPVVASPVGFNRDIVEDGHNGLFASEPSEWIERIGGLLSDSDRRRTLAEAGRKTLEEKFSRPVVARKILEILQGLG